MKPRLLVLVLVATAGLASARPLSAVDSPRWDRDAAARYLDGRMDAWWANAKTLKTDGGETRCLSCHTALPYVWARQALRHSQAATPPTPHEQRVLEQVARRVGYRADDRPGIPTTPTPRRWSPVASKPSSMPVSSPASTGMPSRAKRSRSYRRP